MLFPIAKLPLELRFKVWRSAFPSRDVDIGVPQSYYRLRDQQPQAHIVQKPLKEQFGLILVPVTLWVNHESREETKRLYCLYDYQPAISRPRSDLVLKAICFNPTVDNLCIQFDQPYTWLPSIPGWTFQDHLSTLNLCAAPFVDKIHHIQISNIHKPTADDSIEVLFGREEDPEDDTFNRPTFSWKQFVFQFPQLRNITLQFADKRGYETIMQPMTKFLKANKDRFLTGEAPKVAYHESLTG